jgi:hypothetical protein
MHLAAVSTKPISAKPKPVQPAKSFGGHHYAVEEIGAYMAVRESLLVEAQENLTEAALQRLILANNFVANCLRPATGPYLSQCIAERDAVRELKRCASVDASIAKLRARLTGAA